MRRWVIGVSLVVAFVGLWIAFALPSSTVPDCPPRSTGVPCQNGVDTHPWLRFLVGTAAAVPAIVLVARRYRGKPRAAKVFAGLGIAVSIALWWIAGQVPTTMGDCPPYPHCYRVGHPYGGVAFVVLLITGGMVFWMWEPVVLE
jgi:hypothetical protein